MCLLNPDGKADIDGRPRVIDANLTIPANHLPCTDMTVRVGKADAYVGVEFPDRPKVH